MQERSILRFLLWQSALGDRRAIAASKYSAIFILLAYPGEGELMISDFITEQGTAKDVATQICFNGLRS